MENEIDFEKLERGLEQLKPGRPGRKKTMMQRLEGRREAILKARSKGVSFRALARFFRENGVVVSAWTLRQYVREWTGEGGKRRKKKAGKPRLAAAEAAVKANTTSPLSTAQPSWKKPLPPEERKLPPRLGRKNPLME